MRTHTTPRRLRTALAGLAALALAACATGASEPVPKLDGTAWTLAALGGQDLAPGGPSVTLAFSADRAQGSDGCNRYGRGYTQSAGQLQFKPGPGVSTLMACPGPADALAKGWQQVLADTQSLRHAQGRLLLLGAGGQVLAQLEPQAQGLAGTQWEVLGYNNGQQAVVSLLNGSRATLAFGADGRLSGFGGCNQLMGQYKVDGEGVSFSGVGATRRACLDPTGVMTQESALLRALERASTLRREGDRLELRGANGELQLGLRKAPAK